MKVSVLMITFNHEQYIKQSLDSILCQETDFDYEIVVGEDCSTDGTRGILQSYQQRYPDRIKLLLPEKNLGMMANFMQTFSACSGEYIALLEGDDYWTSPLKLQLQADFLDSHPECAECFHDVEVIVEGKPEKNHLFFSKEVKSFYNLEDIVVSNFISTCSSMFRAGHISAFPDWFATMPMGDWPLHVLNAEKGTLVLLPGTMAAYRVHDGGVWSKSSRIAILEKSIRANVVINTYLDFRYGKTMNRSKRLWEREATALLMEGGFYRRALALAFKAFSNQPRYQFKLIIKTISQIIVQTVRAWCVPDIQRHPKGREK